MWPETMEESSESEVEVVEDPSVPPAAAVDFTQSPGYRDVRLCTSCKTWSYLRKGACLNPSCVSSPH